MVRNEKEMLTGREGMAGRGRGGERLCLCFDFSVCPRGISRDPPSVKNITMECLALCGFFVFYC